jgi:hypothetical protein
MERWKARQTSLFESCLKTTELPEPQRQKALLLLGSLLTEALAMHGDCGDTDYSQEVGRDHDHC